MSIPSRLSDYLEQRGTQYEICAHELSRTSAETARSAHIQAHQLAKSVLLEDDAGCVVAVLPADQSILVSEVNQILGRKDLKLSNENRIAQLFGDCDRGAIPAVGMAWGLDTIVDDDLSNNDTVYLEGGDHERLLQMTREQFQQLMGDQLHGRFCKPTLH